MADQISQLEHNHPHTTGAISSVEQLLLSDDNYDGDNPLLDDDVVNGMMEEMRGDVGGNHGADYPQFCFDNVNVCNETTQFTDFPDQQSAFGNPMRIPVWPVPPSPYSCSCCQILREVFHVNGSSVVKLGIHGRLGLISHAVLERYDTSLSSQNPEYYMFDFTVESISNVKQFLVQYCNDRKSEGYVMLQDPLSNFYDALCTGLDGRSMPQAHVSPYQTSRGDTQTSQEGGLNGVDEEGNGPKSHIASQRERTGKMTLKDLAKYFHLPIRDASKEMNLCPSAIKGICRREGLKRWPHRKIKSVKNEISKIHDSMNSADENEKSRLLIEMQKLQRKLGKFYQGNCG